MSTRSNTDQELTGRQKYACFNHSVNLFPNNDHRPQWKVGDERVFTSREPRGEAVVRWRACTESAARYVDDRKQPVSAELASDFCPRSPLLHRRPMVIRTQPCEKWVTEDSPRHEGLHLWNDPTIVEILNAEYRADCYRFCNWGLPRLTESDD
jgi:hypothetical protein